MTKPPEHLGSSQKGSGHDDPGGLLSSSLARAENHFGAKDTDPKDAAEVWATRIGRGLSLVAFVGLAWYFGHQVNWW
jgi:hypothetical protein